MSLFQKAQRSDVFLKLAITGPTGAGKTFSALRLALGLLEGTGKRIAFIDTENKSASLYAPPEGSEPDGVHTFDFDAMDISAPFEHQKFADGIKGAVSGGYGLVIIDSSSHFWEGILEFKSKLDTRPGSNSYTNWNEAGRKFQTIIDALLQSKIHVICCMRSKMDYVLEDNGKGKQVPRKVGLAPIMRDGISYEFTTVFDVALNHEAETSKDRSQLFTDKIFQITEETGREIAAWLKTATPKVEPVKPQDKIPMTDDEAKAGFVTKFRELLEKERGEHPLSDYETMYCGNLRKGIITTYDRILSTLEDFTVDEFRLLWKYRATAASDTKKQADALTKA